MNEKLWILILSAVALAAGAYVLFFSQTGSVTIYNPDPPGPEFTIVLLRSSPGGDYARVGALRPGARATAVGRDSAGAWLLLEQPRGWVGAHLVEVRGDVDSLPISDEVIALAPPVPGSPVLVLNPKTGNGDAPVDVVASPGLEPDVAAELAPGDSAAAVGRDTAGVWLLLDSPRGWVLGALLEVSGDVTALPVITEIPVTPADTATP